MYPLDALNLLGLTASLHAISKLVVRMRQHCPPFYVPLLLQIAGQSGLCCARQGSHRLPVQAYPNFKFANGKEAEVKKVIDNSKVLSPLSTVHCLMKCPSLCIDPLIVTLGSLCWLYLYM